MASEAQDRLIDPTIQVRRQRDYPHDDLGFLQRIHPLRGAPLGRLVYMADSIMQPMRSPSFGMHPHSNVEVISYVVDGELTHRDSAGNQGLIPPGGFQRITAGTGILHDESNRTGAPLRMFQIWFEPAVADVEPDYALVSSEELLRANRFTTIIGAAGGGAGSGGSASMNADAFIALGRFSSSEAVIVEVAAGRSAMIYLVEGSAEFGEEALDRRDQVRLSGPTRAQLSTRAKSLLMLIESAT